MATDDDIKTAREDFMCSVLLQAYRDERESK